MEIAKTYSPSQVEDKWNEAWHGAKIYKATPDDRPAYSISIPPPNVTGILHMGHMLNNTIQDILIRRKRMLGFNTCWVPGTDHASIATEAKVVKMLADQGIQKNDLSREEFLTHAHAWKDKYGGIILEQLRKMGASCDWDRTAFTMEEEYASSVIKVFCELYDKGHIYRGIRMVNWDPQAQTAVSDEEVNHKDTPGFLYHVKYAVEGERDTFITIATTRPETILGDSAIAIHPEDERYTHLHGKRAIVPLVNRSVPIILDEYVDKEFGTGCLKVTPAHDINDYEIGQRHNLEIIDVLAPDGTISEAGTLYVGEDRFIVRKKISKDLDAAGLLHEKENYTHSVGYSERTDAAIEPRLSMQWFMSMKEVSKPALQAVLDGEVKLIPNKFINTYTYWMENVKDWCLSRQLWWGHQIPAYYLKGSNEFVVAPSKEEALAKFSKKLGKDIAPAELEQDPDVLDTWASSWLWPISVFKGLSKPGNKDFSYYYPTSDLVTAPEILFFWVARMIIAGYEFTGEKPFSNVYLHGIVRDEKRRKMSKSLGNSPDPLDLIATYGADALRVGMMLCSPAGNDLLYKEELVKQGRNFANKIWNAFRLVQGWETSNEKSNAIDKLALSWMDNRIREIGAEIEDHFEKFRISDALMSVYKLIWDDFCSDLLEMVKPPFGEAISSETKEVVLQLFERTLQLLHPFMPFISEEIWQHLRERKEGEFIAISSLELEKNFDKKTLSDFALVKELITAIRAFRKEQKIKFSEPIDLHFKASETSVLETYQPVLEKMLNTSSFQFVSEKQEGMNSVSVRAIEVFIPGGEIDVEAEIEKVEKQITRKEGLLKSSETKLSNERFVNNAPEKVVEMEKKKMADAKAELEILSERLGQLKSM